MFEIQEDLPGKIVFPFGFQVEPGSFESVSLLLDCFTHHFPKTFRNC